MSDVAPASAAGSAAPEPGTPERSTPEEGPGEGGVPQGAAPTPTPDEVKAILRRVKDPELNLNIVDLGLVYDVRVDGSAVTVDVTLTSPGCPSGAEIMAEAEQQLRAMPGVTSVQLNLVWTPFWTPERMEPRVRAYMGF
jgi:metal-sulfur cluster biosynthetic enzyme